MDLLETIRDNPGITHRELKERFGDAWKALQLDFDFYNATGVVTGKLNKRQRWEYRMAGMSTSTVAAICERPGALTATPEQRQALLEGFAKLVADTGIDYEVAAVYIANRVRNGIK